MNIQKEGIVYTPEKIANYIAKTAIEKYLLEKLNNEFSSKMQSINKLFGKYKQKENSRYAILDVEIKRSDKEQFLFILDALKGLSVLDPATGSGNFLIAALKVIEEWYLNLRSLGIINWSEYKIREFIISNNLFGVEIDKKAVEITKQRLYLALDELNSNINNDKTLPNFNFNCRVGNAIIGFLKQSEIVTPFHKNLNDCFYDQIKSLFETHKDLKKIKLSEKEQKAMVFNLKPFHWFQEFPEIIEKGGFDIIIENPPYISNKQLSPLEKAIYQNRYKTPKGLMNIFGIFIERSIELCHSSSILIYIVHKNIIRSNNYDSLRKYILEHTTIQEIIDVGAGLFQSITAETIIIVLLTRIPPKDHKILIKTNFFNQNSYTPNDVLLKNISQKTYLEQENYNFNLELQYEDLEIINYIKETKDCDLFQYFEAKTCIATGDDERFLADHKIDTTYKKTLRGKNIRRFAIDFDGVYVFYDVKALHRARDETIFQKPEKLIMQTISSNLTVAYDNKNYYPLSTCIAIIPKGNVNNSFSIKYLLLLMNSKLMNFYYDFVFNLGAHLTTEISVNNINRLPLKLRDNYGIFNVLAILINKMNENKASREDNKDYTEYFEDLIDTLIFEIIFSDKFQSDGLNTDLLTHMSQYIVNRKLDSIKQIQECIKNIQDDEGISIETKYIKNHPWVKIIEDYFKKRKKRI